MKKSVIKKGYTLEVVSWENDGDYYQTHSKTVQTIEEAKTLWEMMQLCRSGEDGVGNSYDGFTNKQEELVEAFMKEHFKILYPLEVIDTTDREDLIDRFINKASELLGHSEEYACRVMETCTITYSPEYIYLEEITF